MAQGGDVDRLGGIWGVGGAKGNGKAQAVAAHGVWSGQGWAGFPAYTSGRWLLYLPLATAAASTVPAAKVPAAVDDVRDTAGDVVDAVVGPLETVGALADFLTQPGAWQRISKVAIGLTLMAIGAMWIGYTGATRPVFRAVAGADRAIARQVNLRTGPPQ